MENTMRGIAAGAQSESDRPRPRIVTPGTVKLWLLWLAVGLPLFWGVMKALEDVPYLFR
jgi:hypothetical protein